MSTICIQKIDITKLETDAVVNAANGGLREGGGVCGAIFAAAGREELRAACEKIGHCDTGSAVITPGFRLKAKYVIHAVGPMWSGGKQGEPALLRAAYRRALELAAENGCRSVGFPLISSGIFGYPKAQAWEVAIRTCADYLKEGHELDVVFAVRDRSSLDDGLDTLEKLAPQYRLTVKEE